MSILECLKVPFWSFVFDFYINDLTESLLLNAKLFADNTSLFSAIYGIKTSVSNLNKEMNK